MFILALQTFSIHIIILRQKVDLYTSMYRITKSEILYLTIATCLKFRQCSQIPKRRFPDKNRIPVGFPSVKNSFFLFHFISYQKLHRKIVFRIRSDAVFMTANTYIDVPETDVRCYVYTIINK